MLLVGWLVVGWMRSSWRVMAGEEELLVRIAGGSVDEKLLVCDGWWLDG